MIRRRNSQAIQTNKEKIRESLNERALWLAMWKTWNGLAVIETKELFDMNSSWTKDSKKKGMFGIISTEG